MSWHLSYFFFNLKLIRYYYTMSPLLFIEMFHFICRLMFVHRRLLSYWHQRQPETGPDTVRRTDQSLNVDHAQRSACKHLLCIFFYLFIFHYHKSDSEKFVCYSGRAYAKMHSQSKNNLPLPETQQHLKYVFNPNQNVDY